MSTIRQVVEANLDRSYLSHGERAIRALEQREAQAVETIRRAASSAGIDAEQALIDAGLVQPRTSSVNESSAQSGDISLEGIAQSLQRIEQRIDRAAQQAERHGIRF